MLSNDISYLFWFWGIIVNYIILKIYHGIFTERGTPEVFLDNCPSVN